MNARPRPTAPESVSKSSAETVKKEFAAVVLDHRFIIPIGDWSHDGHGKSEEYHFSCNKPFKDVVGAFKRATKKLPTEADPTNIFETYEVFSLTEDAYFAVFDAGYDLLAIFNEPEERARREREIPDETWVGILEYPQVGPDEFVLYILWFCQQGDPELVFHDENGASPRLFGYGGIAKHVGYGLFS